MDKLKAAVLGATGLVGQCFVNLLSDHPWFEVSALTASPSSVGSKYGEKVSWSLPGRPPENIAEMKILEADITVLKREGVDLAFSALPAGVAAEVEPKLAEAGIPVISNARAFRMEDDVPLLIPEVNHEQINLVESQMKRRDWKSFIITSPNCTTTILALSLKPIFKGFGIKCVFVVSMQAISGAGLRGLPSTAIMDNVIPYISGEEEKVESETRKIFGEEAEFRVSASCNRVPVTNGHTEVVFVETVKEAIVEEVTESFRSFKSVPQELSLPTAPKEPIIVREGDRPQPRLDRLEGKGMSIVVGRIRRDPVLGKGFKYVVLGHNLIRGAAGNTVLNAELAYEMGYL